MGTTTPPAEPRDSSVAAAQDLYLPCYAGVNDLRRVSRRGWNRLAICSAALGILPVFSVLSIPVGFYALGQIHARSQRGMTPALFGIVAGIAWIPLVFNGIMNARG